MTCRSLVIRLVHNNASATFPIKHQARFVIGQSSNTTKVLTATHVKVNLPVRSLLKFLQSGNFVEGSRLSHASLSISSSLH